MNDLAGDQGGIVRVVQVVEQGNKLVAAYPCDQVILTHGSAQPVGDHGEQQITQAMAEGVVDLLEVVQVDIEQGESGRAALPAQDHAVQLGLEQGPIAKAGQRILACHLVQFLATASTTLRVDQCARECVGVEAFPWQDVVRTAVYGGAITLGAVVVADQQQQGFGAGSASVLQQAGFIGQQAGVVVAGTQTGGCVAYAGADIDFKWAGRRGAAQIEQVCPLCRI